MLTDLSDSTPVSRIDLTHKDESGRGLMSGFKVSTHHSRESIKEEIVETEVLAELLET